MSIDPIIVVRGLHFAATVLATGTVTFVALIADPNIDALRRQLIALTWSALAFAVLTGAAWLLLFAADLAGAPILDLGAAWTVLTETRFGLIAGARLALAAALALLIVRPSAHLAALAAAAVFIALVGWIGHAGATPGLAGDLQLASDVTHLLAAGAWLGGLPALALLLAGECGPADPDSRIRAAETIRRFGRLGLICVAALLASGLFNAWNLLARPQDLTTTDYGRLLSLKLALAAAMVAIAAVNRYRLTPRAAEPATQRALWRNSLAEAALGLGVLLLVGALGTLPPPTHRHSGASEALPEAAFLHIHAYTLMAEVSILPGRVGPAAATVRVSREDGAEFPAKAVRLALDPPAVTATPIDQPAVHQPDGSWIVQRLEIGQPGIWTARVIVTADGGTPIVLDAPVVIEP